MAKKKTQRKAKSFSEALGLEYLFNNTITDFFLGINSLLRICLRHHCYGVVSQFGGSRPKYIGRFATGRMDQYRTTVSELLRLAGAIISYWLMSVNFGFPAFPAAFVLRAGGLSTHACL